LNTKLFTSVGTKFGLAFALVLLMIVGNSLFAISRMGVINESTSERCVERWALGQAVSRLLRIRVKLRYRSLVGLSKQKQFAAKDAFDDRLFERKAGQY
jgi:hypothetical protein